MKGIKISVAVAALALSVAIAGSVAHAQSEVTQEFTLYEGWNAIFLEVRPDPRDPVTVFADLENLESVWTWLSKGTTAEFIQDPSEELYGQPGWLAYFPPGTTSFLTNLHAVLGNQAYLIKMSAAESWQVTGSPSMRKINWLPDSFNMVGFHLDPENPPNFAGFFAPSRAHAGQAVYRLNNLSGKWEFVQDPATATMRSGEAYWVYCEGSSTYQGPLNVSLPMGDGLHFGETLTRQTVTLTNRSYVTRTVGLALLFDEEDVDELPKVLEYREWNQTSGYFIWRPLDQMSAITLQPESSRNVWLRVRRDNMAVGLYESVLEIADDKGIRIRVPVSAERIQ